MELIVLTGAPVYSQLPAACRALFAGFGGRRFAFRRGTGDSARRDFFALFGRGFGQRPLRERFAFWFRFGDRPRQRRRDRRHRRRALGCRRFRVGFVTGGRRVGGTTVADKVGAPFDHEPVGALSPLFPLRAEITDEFGEEFLLLFL